MLGGLLELFCRWTEVTQLPNEGYYGCEIELTRLVLSLGGIEVILLNVNTSFQDSTSCLILPITM
jgi:hypothetical protein